jgi:hypothetical protein
MSKISPYSRRLAPISDLPVSWVDLAPVVPFPALYIDTIMPALTDAEWRILCVIIRQTLGWQDKGNSKLRKGRDWLTHSQFKVRTGKSGDSISKSIDSLVRCGLIVVEREDGSLLNHASSRRRARSRLYYRLGVLPRPQRTLDGEEVNEPKIGEAV